MFWADSVMVVLMLIVAQFDKNKDTTKRELVNYRAKKLFQTGPRQETLFRASIRVSSFLPLKFISRLLDPLIVARAGCDAM